MTDANGLRQASRTRNWQYIIVKTARRRSNATKASKTIYIATL